MEIFERSEVSQFQVPAWPASDVLVRIVETRDDRFPIEVNSFCRPVVAGQGAVAYGVDHTFLNSQGGVDGKTVTGGDNPAVYQEQVNFSSGTAS